MSKRGICIALFVVFTAMVGLGWAQEADPNLVAWWKLDEGAGDTAMDSAGDYDGTLQGGPTWVSGVVDGALQFDGGDDSIEVGTYPVFNSPEGSFSVALWTNVNNWAGEWVNSMIGNRSDGVGWCLRRFGGWWQQNYPERYTMPNTVLSFTTRGIGHDADGVEDSPSNTTPPIGEWTHIACVYDSDEDQKVIYFNGVEDAVWPTNPSGVLIEATQRFYIGARSNSGDTGPEAHFNGRLDDVRFYDRALDANEVAVLAIAPITFKAKDPSPLDGADMISAPLLQWTPADVADTQRLYFGTNQDLGEGDLLAEGLTDSSFQVTDALEPFTTYFWRVDAVEADGVTVNTGEVWQFDSGPVIAFNPDPQNEYLWAAPDADLNWFPGVSAVAHEVYFGPNEFDVGAGINGTFKGSQAETSFDPGDLDNETVYYWRVDEVEADGETRHIGPVWRFKTRPELTVTDPNLVGWWPLDEGQGTVALDWSGHGNHGVFNGDPQWVIGHEGGALALDGIGDYVDCGNAEILNLQTNLTMAVWVKVAAFTRDWEAIIAKGDGAYRLSRSATNGDATHMGVNGTSANFFDGTIVVTDDEWHHIAGTFDGANARLYVDGVVDVSSPATGQVNSSTDNFYIGENSGAGSRYLGGLIDDVRLYNRALSQNEVEQIMRGDTTKAWNPAPATGLITDIVRALPLTWSAGDNAVAHEVYLSTDAFAVGQATPESAGIYRGRLTETNFTPSDLEWDSTYYWRVDEITGDGTVNKGWTWVFTVADYIIVDDIEQYTDNRPDRIFESWRDRYEYTDAQGNVVDEGNGTGMTVGIDEAPYGPERTIVHGGSQSMPLTYDNSFDPFYSETNRTFAQVQDWSARSGRSLDTLSLWYRGRWESPNRFLADNESGITYFVTGSGTDIWNTADQFHFAYLPLNGDGSIIARIDEIDNTDTWAKAGVMIRNGLGAGAANVAVLVAPSGRVTAQIREFEGADTTSEETGAGSITVSHWVKLTREGSIFTAEHSTDGQNWESVGINTPVSINMFGDVYMGLAVTSHVDAGTPCQAEFTNVQVTGASASVFSTSMDIGLPVNDPAELTVSIQDASGTTATLVHPDGTNAVLQNDWLEWQILLSDIADQGVDLTQIMKMAISIGNQQPDGTGKLYIDDIRLYPE